MAKNLKTPPLFLLVIVMLSHPITVMSQQSVQMSACTITIDCAAQLPMPALTPTPEPAPAGTPSTQPPYAPQPTYTPGVNDVAVSWTHPGTRTDNTLLGGDCTYYVKLTYSGDTIQSYYGPDTSATFSGLSSGVYEIEAKCIGPFGLHSEYSPPVSFTLP